MRQVIFFIHASSLSIQIKYGAKDISSCLLNFSYRIPYIFSQGCLAFLTFQYLAIYHIISQIVSLCRDGHARL